MPKEHSVYLMNVNEESKTATVARLPLNKENENGETLILVRDHAVKFLAKAAYNGNSGLIKKLAEQDIRSQINNTPEFETVTVNIDINKMEGKKTKGKGKDKDDSEEDDEEVEPVEPVSLAY